jgi:predicted O-methyltransferase YrrM
LFLRDAGHSRDDYIDDFKLVVGNISSGGVVIVDDIRWNDTRLIRDPAECYEGWKEIVNHPRVIKAVEIGESIGLMLLN